MLYEDWNAPPATPAERRRLWLELIFSLVLALSFAIRVYHALEDLRDLWQGIREA